MVPSGRQKQEQEQQQELEQQEQEQLDPLITHHYRPQLTASSPRARLPRRCRCRRCCREVGSHPPSPQERRTTSAHISAQSGQLQLGQLTGTSFRLCNLHDRAEKVRTRWARRLLQRLADRLRRLHHSRRAGGRHNKANYYRCPGHFIFTRRSPEEVVVVSAAAPTQRSSPRLPQRHRQHPLRIHQSRLPP